MIKEYIKEYEMFLNAWGKNSQILMCVEELSELSQALCKYIRINENENEYNEEKKQKNLYNVKEEIADVLNTALQMREMFGTEEVDQIRQEKIDRCVKKLPK